MNKEEEKYLSELHVKILNEIAFVDKDRTIYELQGRLNELQEEYDIQNIILQNISKTQINKEKLRNALTKLKTIQNIWKRGGEHAIEEIGVVIENHDGRGFKINESYIDLEEGCAKLSIEYNIFQEYLERAEGIDIADTKSIYVENINQIIDKYILRD